MQKLKRTLKKLVTSIWQYSLSPKWSRLYYFYTGNTKAIYSTIVILGVIFNLEKILLEKGISLPYSNFFGMPSYSVVYLISCVGLVGSVIFTLSCPRIFTIVNTRTDYVTVSMQNLYIWNAQEKIRLISESIGSRKILFGDDFCEIRVICDSIHGRIRSENKKGADKLPEDIQERFRHLLQVEYDSLNQSAIIVRVFIALLKNVFILISSLIFVETVYNHIIKLL